MARLSTVLSGLRASSRYRTRARYVEDQPDFINAAVCGHTDLSPADLLAATQAIEAALGRDRRAERFKGPRTLDIDILLFGDRVVSEPGLAIPHPGLCERAFALVPLLELDPSLRLPPGGESLSAILACLPDQGIYPLDRGRIQSASPSRT